MIKQDDASQRVVGLNPIAGKNFYHEISVNDHPDTYLDLEACTCMR